MSTEPRASRWQCLWPPVNTPEQARNATTFALVAAIVCGLGSAALGAAGALGLEFATAAGFNLDALADAVVFILIAWGLSKRSRFAAWSGLVLYVGQRVLTWSTVGVTNPVIAAILILAFVSGVRGTSALHRMRTRPFEGNAT
jgi:hypothetical protein